MDWQYFIGLDLGQVHDPTALCVSQRSLLPPNEQRRREFLHTVRYLSRFDLGTSYPAIARHVANIIDMPLSRIDPTAALADARRRDAQPLHDAILVKDMDDRIRTRAEHWRIERMAIVDRNVLRLAVYEFLYHDTPNNVAINEALEIARRFSTYEATQFINGILDGIKQDLESKDEPAEKSQASSN